MSGLEAVWPWMRANLFGSWSGGLVTLVLAVLVVWPACSLIGWALLDAVWTIPAAGAPGAPPCRAVAGACWAVIVEKHRFILFGKYPYEQHARPAAAVCIVLLLYGMTGMRRFWRRWLLPAWAAGLVLSFLLMRGGVAGLEPVPPNQWGGLPVTLMLATFGVAAAMPLAVVLALGRRSRTLPAIRWLCIGYVELVRGVPLVSLLFMASVMVPLFLPDGLSPDKLLRAQAAIVLFAAAYLAEVVRAGLQALPEGQHEAAAALGLRRCDVLRLVVLPQALRLVIPSLVNTFIGIFKDTSLVLVIGIFDLMTSGRVALADPLWRQEAAEIYLFLGVIYFAFCFAMARYSRGLERTFSPNTPT